MLQFEDDLKANLSFYSELSNQKKEIDKKLDQLKESFKKWLEVNNISEYEGINTIGEQWKLSILSKKTTKIDKDLLITILPQDQLNKIISFSESSYLTCRKLASLNSTPSAPKGV